MQCNDCTLVIMAKAPKPGRVKTRLAGCLPPEEIPQLYRCLLNDTIALAKSLAGVETAIVSPVADVAELKDVLGSSVDVVAQEGSGLGDALRFVFSHFTRLGPRRVVAFNSDSPHLPGTTLQAAFDVLSDKQLAIGPTFDGGYYLVGATASHAGLFSSESLGTASALDALMNRASSQNLSIGFTDTFWDVDVRADLNRLSEELKLTPERAPQTANWLRAWSDKMDAQPMGENN